MKTQEASCPRRTWGRREDGGGWSEEGAGRGRGYPVLVLVGEWGDWGVGVPCSGPGKEGGGGGYPVLVLVRGCWNPGRIVQCIFRSILILIRRINENYIMLFAVNPKKTRPVFQNISFKPHSFVIMTNLRMQISVSHSVHISCIRVFHNKITFSF